MHSANVDGSIQLQRVLVLLVGRGEQGATSREIGHLAEVVAVSAAIYALRENGIVISCVPEGKTEQGANVYRYRYVGYEPDGDPGDKFKHARPAGWSPRLLDLHARLIASDPPAPLADSDGSSSPADIGYQEILNPPPDVPGHLIGEVIRFERMGREEKARYQAVCEGHAKDGTCFVCRWIIEGDHLDELPTHSRKGHVLVCCDPALDSNADYLRRSQTAPAGDVAIPHRDGIGRPSRGTPSPATAAGAA